MDYEMERESDRVMLVDDEGVETPFVVVATLNLDDTEYALLSEESKQDTDEIMVFRIVGEGEDLVFEGVDDDEEIDEVLLAANELFSESEDEEA